MGSASGSGSAQVGARQGGGGGGCRWVPVGEDVQPLVGAVLPRAVVPDVLPDQSPQRLECEVLVLRFARRRSCAESVPSPAEWARPQVRDARAAEPVQLLRAAAAEVMPAKGVAVVVVHLHADPAWVPRPWMRCFTFGHPEENNARAASPGVWPAAAHPADLELQLAVPTPVYHWLQAFHVAVQVARAGALSQNEIKR